MQESGERLEGTRLFTFRRGNWRGAGYIFFFRAVARSFGESRARGSMGKGIFNECALIIGRIWYGVVAGEGRRREVENGYR